MKSFVIVDLDKHKAWNSEILAGNAKSVKNNVFSRSWSNEEISRDSKLCRTKSKSQEGTVLVADIDDI